MGHVKRKDGKVESNMVFIMSVKVFQGLLADIVAHAYLATQQFIHNLPALPHNITKCLQIVVAPDNKYKNAVNYLGCDIESMNSINSQLQHNR